MPDAPATYPLLRGRRHGRRRWARRVRTLATGWPARIMLILLAVGAIAGGIAMLAARAARPSVADAVPAARAAIGRGNYSAARNHLLDAVAADPDDGIAQAELGRVYILLGDGARARGAIDRAASDGIPAARLHHLRAAAMLLQRDVDGALGEAARATGTDIPYARRVRARALAARGDRAGAVALLQQAVAIDPRDTSAWSDLGRVRFDRGDVAGAEDAATRASAIDPANLAALVLRGEVVRSRYGLVAALPWFRAALSRDAYFHPALIEYAGTLGDAGQYGASLEAARRALASRPGSPQALYLMAAIAARAGKYDLAARLLDRTGGALNGLPGGLLLSGGIDYASGRYEQAVLKWRALVQRQPMNLAARRLLGAAQLRAGDAAGALATLRPVALRADADTYTLGLVGRAFEAQGQRDWAARFLDRAARPAAAVAAPFGQDDSDGVLAEAVRRAPGDPRAAVAWLRGLLANGEHPAALAAAETLVQAAPGAPVAYMLLGDVQRAGGAPADAAASYARAADLRFDQPIMLRLLEAWSASGHPDRAAAALSLYAGQNPVSVVARRALANMQLRAGEAKAAVDTLESLRTDIGGGDVVLLAQLAYAYTAAGDPATAIGYARAGYRLQPLNPAVTDAWGWALFERGDTPHALELLTKAATLAPAHAGIRWHLGQAQADAGQTQAARVSITTALRDPAFTDRDAATKLLAALPRG